MARRKSAGAQPATKPFQWTEEIEAEIFKRIAGGESLRKICDDDWMPNRETVRRRLVDDETFCGQYARAREAQADTLFDQILDIADDATNDFMQRDGVEVPDTEHIQRSKLRIEARKWMAGKLRPKVYGDKLDVEHTGGVTVNITGKDADL